MIKLRLPELAKEKGIEHPSNELVKRGITSKQAHNYLHNKHEWIVQDHLEIMCLVFRCSINSLFEVTPDNPATADLTQPVYTEHKPKPKFDLLKEAAKLTDEELRKLFGVE